MGVLKGKLDWIDAAGLFLLVVLSLGYAFGAVVEASMPDVKEWIIYLLSALVLKKVPSTIGATIGKK